MIDKHLRDLTPADLPLLADADDATLDRLCHELMRRDGPVPEEEAITYITSYPPHRLWWEYSATDGQKVQRIAVYRRPIEPLCRPDVPLDRLLGLVQAVGSWIGTHCDIYCVSDGDATTAIIIPDARNEQRQAMLRDFDEGDYHHIAHAIVLACLAAAIVYGEKR